MLEEWHDFYLLIGGAAGALIGLLFVVVSLTGGMNEATERGRQLYISPVVFHFSVVLGTGGLAMAPHVPMALAALLESVAAVTGLICMALVSAGMFRAQSAVVPHWSDPWWYGVAALAIYAVMLIAAVIMWTRPGAGLDVLAAAMGALLALGVRNAWDLITWIAPRSSKTV